MASLSGRQVHMTQLNIIKTIVQRLAPTLTVLPLLTAGCAVDAQDPSDRSDESANYSASGGRGGTFQGNSSGGAASGADNDGPVLVPFEQLYAQTVQWFDKDVTIETAETWISSRTTARVHVITLKVQNRTRWASDNSYQSWDLFLANGKRLAGRTPSHDYGPQDAVSFVFEFEDPAGLSLDGAYLELNGTNYGVYQPLILPLDAPASEPVFIVNDLQGHVFEGVVEGKAVWRHEIVSARVSRSSDAHDGHHRMGARARAGKKLLDLVVRTTAVDGGTNLQDDVYHLLVNGEGVSTHTTLREIAEPGQTFEVPVVFQIDENATAITVEFDIQQGRGMTWSTIDVDLANATPAQ